MFLAGGNDLADGIDDNRGRIDLHVMPAARRHDLLSARRQRGQSSLMLLAFRLALGSTRSLRDRLVTRHDDERHVTEQLR